MPRRRSGGKRKAPQPSRKANDSVLSQRVTFRHSGTVAVYDEHEGVPLRPREAVAHPAAGADDEDDEDEEEEEDGDERSEGEGLYDDGPIEGFGTARNMQVRTSLSSLDRAHLTIKFRPTTAPSKPFTLTRTTTPA